MTAADAGAPPDAAAGHTLVAGILADHALTAEILFVLAGAVLVVIYRSYRRSGAPRRSAHVRTRNHQSPALIGSVTSAGRVSGMPRPAAGDPWLAASTRRPGSPPRPAAAPPAHVDDYPSWPGRPGPYALHPDHPSWPGRPDPRWAATETALRADSYPSWPEPQSPPWQEAEQPAAGGPHWPAGDGYNGGPGGGYGGGPGGGYGGGPGGGYNGGLGAHQQAPTLFAAPVAPTLPARIRTAPQMGASVQSLSVRQEHPAGVVDRAWPQADPGSIQVWDAGSAQLATWIISDANDQAAGILDEAREQATTSLEDAKQHAAELVKSASEQAAAALAAADLEAAKIRATITKLSVELGGVAARVTEDLVGFAPPAAKPAVPPATQPATQPVAQPAGRPGPKGRTAARPSGTSSVRSADRLESGTEGRPRTAPERPKGQPRQMVAFRVAATATALLFMFAVVAGSAEIALHGFAFFVFRSTGTGETGPTGLQEDQGPGQPDAPKPVPSHIAVTVHKG
jgi:hypothetical protein